MHVNTLCLHEYTEPNAAYDIFKNVNLFRSQLCVITSFAHSLSRLSRVNAIIKLYVLEIILHEIKLMDEKRLMGANCKPSSMCT